MKKLSIFTIVLLFMLPLFSQKHVYISKEHRDHAIPMQSKMERMEVAANPSVPWLTPGWLSVEEEHIGLTRYDLQTQASISNRICLFDDYTLGAVFSMGFESSQFMDKGTGYNYFNGSEWGAFPDTTLETVRTGWPVYQPFGENGEIVVSFISESGLEGLVFNWRPEKFQGNWATYNFSGPSGFESLPFPRLATGGIDHNTIHLLAQTQDINYPYQGVLHAPLYSRSTDGLVSWDVNNQLLDPLSAAFYPAFSFDQFNLIADGDFVAILYGDFWNDMGLLKSEDGGNSWDQTIIWEHPYPQFNYEEPSATDTFYCVDGSHHLAFDADHLVHVVFAISRAYADDEQTYWFPAVDGIAYWNEERPIFSNNLNALSPYGHPDTELVEDYSLIGWTQDLNGNGELDILGDWGNYYLGFSSMPQITFWNWTVFVVYASVTENFNNGVQDYRHLWARTSPNDGDWWGPFTDLTDDISHIFDECIFPSAAVNSDGFIHVLYQKDPEPGLAIRGDLDPYGDNFMTYMKVDLGIGIEEQKGNSIFDVSQNFPNPFSVKSYINVNVRKTTMLYLEVTNLLGQVIYSTPKKLVQPGTLRLDIDANEFTPGIYFYSVKAGEEVVTKKMIVD